MARTVASLPSGSRITDYISLGVMARTFPLEKVKSVLAVTGRSSIERAGFASPCCSLLRHSLGAVYAVLLPGGAALLVGRNSVVDESKHQD